MLSEALLLIAGASQPIVDAIYVKKKVATC